MSEIIGKGFPVTAQLGIQALLLALAVALPLGVISALRQNTMIDYGSLFFATVGTTIPSFVMAIFFIYIFGLGLHLFPITGWGTPQHMVMPTVILALGAAAFLARITRASMLEAIRQDYVRTARSKGLREQVVIVGHVLKNAMIPVATVVGPAAAGLITGSFIIETFFSRPGIGREYVLQHHRARLSRDHGDDAAVRVLHRRREPLGRPRVRHARSAHQGREIVATASTTQERAAELNVLVRKQRSLWGDALYRLMRNKAAVAGLIVIAAAFLVAIFAPVLAPYNPILIPPSSELASQMEPQWTGSKYTDPRYLLGTDFLGRDILSRLIYASRDQHGRGLHPDGDRVLPRDHRRHDRRLLRRLARSAADALHRHHLRVPGLPVPDHHRRVVPEQSVREAHGRPAADLRRDRDRRLGRRRAPHAWPGAFAQGARIRRGRARGRRDASADHGQAPAARTLSRRTDRERGVRVPSAILGEATLSFLGLGIIPPTPSWGQMINEGFPLFSANPWAVLLPAICISVVMLAFTFVGDGLRDALDPRMKT